VDIQPFRLTMQCLSSTFPRNREGAKRNKWKQKDPSVAKGRKQLERLYSIPETFRKAQALDNQPK
jgi:hypothetical protein